MEYALPYDERSRRLRFYLLAVAACNDPLLAWMATMEFEQESIDDVHYLIDIENLDDARLLGLIERGAHPVERIVRFTHGGWRPG